MSQQNVDKLRDAAEAAKDKAREVADTVKDKARDAAEAAKDKATSAESKLNNAAYSARSPAQALNDKLGTTVGSRGFFNSALQFAKLNSWVWGSAALVGLTAYYFSDSLRAETKKPAAVVVVKPEQQPPRPSAAA